MRNEVLHAPGPTELTVRRHVHVPCPNGGKLATHACAVALLVEAGSLSFEQHGTWRAHEGDVVLVPAGSAHRTATPEAAQVRGVAFPLGTQLTADLGPMLAPFERVRRGATCVASLGPRRAAFSHAMDELAACPRSASGPLLLRAWLTVLLGELEAASAATPSLLAPTSKSRNHHGELVADALACIEARALGPLSLADVAQALRRSTSHVAHAVKTATGQSVGQWILRRRLDEARLRLRSTEERVEIVAERVGYAEPSHFVRLFRRAEGVSPAAYRRASRG